MEDYSSISKVFLSHTSEKPNISVAFLLLSAKQPQHPLPCHSYLRQSTFIILSQSNIVKAKFTAKQSGEFPNTNYLSFNYLNKYRRLACCTLYSDLW
jgi:hypothetical protein